MMIKTEYDDEELEILKAWEAQGKPSSLHRRSCKLVVVSPSRSADGPAGTGE
jgi:hypothetical protein